MTETITLTDSAAGRINVLINKGEQSGAMLRIAVNGGGCSGFQYDYSFVYAKENGDTAISHNGATVLIDETSLPFMSGCIIDYVETLGSAMFVIKNPNAATNCGCGNSFSV